MAKIQEIEVGSSVILICSGPTSGEAISTVYKTAADKYKATCIVAVGKSADRQMHALQKNEIDHSKFLYIDCVDKTHVGKDKCQCIHLGTSQSLTELSISIKKVVNTKKFDTVVIDNVSSMLLYNKDVTIARFLHDLIAQLRGNNVRFIGIVLGKDMKGSLKELELFVDRVESV